ncbi:hypothetical protein [Thioclava atlantica]|uniref:Uncharacterized protein n=1 Tax=Thioclava atlantica TaxID=1317124 RepID=A0A085TYZ2_9RHOB|nr:hypothetical protein [Thioclava atlantica]KFE35939.1 hypothetical protein DW2_04900 [Thioclava atlantica]
MTSLAIRGGTSNFTVRTYSTKGSYQEVKGVPCTFKADGFHAEFTTPAVVVTPDMGPRTPVASISCVYQGEKVFRIVQPINDTTTKIDQNAAAAGAGAGLIGVIVTGISSSSQRARRDATLDVYGYPDQALQFKGARK